VKLYHGTSLENAVNIKKEGFHLNYADHPTELLSKIHEYAREKDYRKLYIKADQRLAIRPALNNRISFVEHFNVARIWAKENRLGTEMQHCLLDVYDVAVKVLLDNLNVEWYQELVNQHKHMHKKLQQFIPVVITAEMDASLVRQGGMKFKVPKDGSYLQ
jgi:hypothetical protein